MGNERKKKEKRSSASIGGTNMGIILSWDFVLPLLVPLIRAGWAYRIYKPSKLPTNFYLDLLWRTFAFAGAVAYVYSALTNLPTEFNINFFLSTTPLTIIGVAYILNYVWSDLGHYLDASFRLPEAVSVEQSKKLSEANAGRKTARIIKSSKKEG